MQKLVAAEEGRFSPLFRDIFRNPFRTVTAGLLLPNERHAVADLAQVIYDGRAFERMPVLAEVLENTGCENADILEHCRSQGPHVRGCWVLDLILGKN